MVARGKKEEAQLICLVEMIWKIKTKIRTKCLLIHAHIIIIKMELPLEILIKQNLMDSTITATSGSLAIIMANQEAHWLQNKTIKQTNKNQVFKFTVVLVNQIIL